MMFCHRCGARLPDDAVFCMKCGTRRATLDGDGSGDGEGSGGWVDAGDGSGGKGDTRDHDGAGAGLNAGDGEDDGDSGNCGDGPDVSDGTDARDRADANDWPGAGDGRSTEVPHVRNTGDAAGAGHVSVGGRELTPGRMSSTQLINLLQPLNEQFAQIDALEDGIRSARAVMDRNNLEYGVGVACFLLSGLIGGVALLYAYVSRPWDHDSPVFALIACLVAVVPLLVGLNQTRVFKHNVDDVIPDLYPAIATDERAIDDIRKAMRPTLLRLPVNCRSGEANAYILQMLMCGRADDFNTAVSLWEAYDHRRQMEQFERDKVEEARKQTTALTVSAVAQVSQAFEAKRQTRELRGLRDDLNNRR